MAQIDAFFKLMNEQQASDLHLAAGKQPILRVRGELERVKYNPLDNDSLKSMLYEITPEHKIKVFEETGDVDFAYEIRTKLRYLKKQGMLTLPMRYRVWHATGPISLNRTTE
jgi:twitching motility protein PilT